MVTFTPALAVWEIPVVIWRVQKSARAIPTARQELPLARRLYTAATAAAVKASRITVRV